MDSSSASTTREAAKWLVGAFAVVLATLAAGIQLSALGSMNAGHPRIAYAAAALGIVATTWAIVRASQVLIDPGISLDDLLGREVDARLKARNSPSQDQDLPDELSHHDPLLEAIFHNRSLIANPNPLPSELRDQYDLAQSSNDAAKQSATQSDIRQAVEISNRFYFAEKFRRLSTHVVFSTIAVLISVLAFSWAITPNPSKGLDVTQAHAATLMLAPKADPEALGLGNKCQEESLQAVIIGGSFVEPLIVTQKTADCTVARFLVTDEVGSVIPKVK